MFPNLQRLLMFVVGIITVAAASPGSAHNTCQYLQAGMGHGCVYLDDKGVHRRLIACDDDFEDGWEVISIARTNDGKIEISIRDEMDIAEPGCWEYRLGEANSGFDGYVVCANRPNKGVRCTRWKGP
jgi:hypothetical protein